MDFSSFMQGFGNGRPGGGNSQSGMVNVDSNRTSSAFSNASNRSDWYQGDMVVIGGGSQVGALLLLAAVGGLFYWVLK